MKKVVLSVVGGVLVVVGVIAGAVYLMTGKTPTIKPEREDPSRRIVDNPNAAKFPSVTQNEKKGKRPKTAGKKAPVARNRRHPNGPAVVMPEFTPEEQKLVEAVETACDTEDFTKTCKAADAAFKSKNPEVRRQAVDALSWFGKKAVPELVTALGDSDRDVADDAQNAIEVALADMEEPERIAYIKQLLSVDYACSAETVESLATMLKGTEDEIATMSAAVDLIETSSNPTVVEEMKETYQFVTGEEFVDRATAEQWAVNKAAEELSDGE